MQALELLQVLDDPMVYSMLLRGIGQNLEDGGLFLGRGFPVSAGRRGGRLMQWAQLSVLASAPPSLPAAQFRHSVRYLYLCTSRLNGALLASFPHLERLAVERVIDWGGSDVVEPFVGLKKLRMVNCAQPPWLGSLSAVHQLGIQGAPWLVDLEAIAPCARIQSLSMVQVDALQRLTGVPEGVEMVQVRRARALHDLSALSRCTSLRKLTLKGCVALQTFSGLSAWPDLEELRIFQAPLLEDFSALRRVRRMHWPGPLTNKQLQALARLNVGELVLDRPRVDPKRVPSALRHRVRWRG